MESQDVDAEIGPPFDPLASPSSSLSYARSHSQIVLRCEGIRAHVEELLGSTSSGEETCDGEMETREELSLSRNPSQNMTDSPIGTIPMDGNLMESTRMNRKETQRQEEEFDGHCCSPKFWGSVVTLCSATLGAAVLSLPYACAQVGWVWGLVLFVTAAWATLSSIQLLVKACTFYQLYTYESLTLVLYGPKLRTLLEFCIVVFCLGCAVAYLIAIADILQQANLLFFHNSRNLTMILIWACILLPLSLLRTMAAFQLSSAIAIASIGTLLFAAIVHLLDDTLQQGHTQITIEERLLQHNTTQSISAANTVNWSEMIWPQNGFVSVFTACPIILFAFSCQVNVCAIYEELPPITSSTGGGSTAAYPLGENERFMNRVTFASVVLCAILYISISLVTLADFGLEHVTPNILNAYHQPLQGIMQVAAAGMVLAVTMAFPLNIFPARVTMEGVWHNNCPIFLSSSSCCCLVWKNRSTVPQNRGAGDGRSTCFCCFQKRLQEQQNEEELHLDSLTEPLLPNEAQLPAGESDSDALVVPLEEAQTPTIQTTISSKTGVPKQQEKQQSHHPEPQLPDNSRGNDPSSIPTQEDDGTLPAFSWIRHIFLTLLLAGTALAIALVAPNISVVFQIIGGTASSVVGFCVPGLLGLRLGRDLEDGSVTCISRILLFGGALIAIVTTVVTIYQIVTGTN